MPGSWYNGDVHSSQQANWLKAWSKEMQEGGRSQCLAHSQTSALRHAPSSMILSEFRLFYHLLSKLYSPDLHSPKSRRYHVPLCSQNLQRPRTAFPVQTDLLTSGVKAPSTKLNPGHLPTRKAVTQGSRSLLGLHCPLSWKALFPSSNLSPDSHKCQPLSQASLQTQRKHMLLLPCPLIPLRGPPQAACGPHLHLPHTLAVSSPTTLHAVQGPLHSSSRALLHPCPSAVVGKCTEKDKCPLCSTIVPGNVVTHPCCAHCQIRTAYFPPRLSGARELKRSLLLVGTQCFSRKGEGGR